MSGLIPRAFLDELLNRIDLVELINSYVPLKKSGRNFVACCPFHNEKSPSFNVRENKQFYHCFGCQVSGNAISFIMEYTNVGFVEAVELIAARVGLTIPRAENTEKYNQSHTLYQILEKVSNFYQQTLKNQGQQAIDYLKQRGINGSIAKLYQLGFASEAWHLLENKFKIHKKELITTGMIIQKEDGKCYDRYRNRITFPIHDKKGRLIGFGGRVIDNNQKPKYLNSPESIIFQKNRELYGLYQAIKVNPHPERLIIVEGYLDVIALAQHGISYTVATLGTATSSSHIQLLSRYTKQLYFCFDGDSAGIQAAWRALENCLPHLDLGLDIRFIFLPEGNDPDNFIRQEGVDSFLNCVEQALEFNQYFINTLTKNFDLHTTAGKSQFINAAKPFFQIIPDCAYKQLLIDEIARITLIESRRVEQLLQAPLQQQKPTTNQPISRSPLRLAMALLLQNPSLYFSCKDNIKINELDKKEQQILTNIIQEIIKNPQITTAALVECWRDTDLFNPLTKLAVWEHGVPPEEMAKELTDIIIFIQKKNIESKINLYMTKSRKEGLTVNEKQDLQQLLQERHQ